MDIRGNDVTVSVNPAEQSNEWLIDVAQEIADEARNRGLELPFATGVVAVEGTMQDTKDDIEVLAPATKESLAEQLPAAHRGYQAVVDTLNSDSRKKDQVKPVDNEALASEFDTWFTEDKLAYVISAQDADPSLRFTLVAMPNVLVSHQGVIKAAKTFGQNQPYQIYEYDEHYSNYNAEQLSGTNPENGKAVVFSLIPSTCYPEMTGTIEEQRTRLAELQAANPYLKVPSVLEAITYWQTLRAQGETLTDSTTLDKTYIRHFDLPEQRFFGWLGVPDSYVRDDGKPSLSDSLARKSDVARVAVG